VNTQEFERLSRARQRSLAHTAPKARIADHRLLDWGAPTAIDPALLEGVVHYDPYDHPESANALAKVTDERSALRFARRFGLLGYGETLLEIEAELANRERRGIGSDPLLDRQAVARLRAATEPGFGDPLTWLYAQARAVRLVLDLIAALPKGPAALVRTGEGHGTLRLDDEGHVSARSVELAYGLESKTLDLEKLLLRARRPGELAEEKLRPVLATVLIEELVNINTAGLRWRLYAPPAHGPYELSVGFGQRALFEVVWWHVGNAAVAGTPGARVRLCELETCRTPFIVTDERQHFCPADYTYTDKRTGKTRPGRSRCAALYQKRHGPRGGRKR